jgi:hypothetical protein
MALPKLIRNDGAFPLIRMEDDDCSFPIMGSAVVMKDGAQVFSTLIRSDLIANDEEGVGAIYVGMDFSKEGGTMMLKTHVMGKKDYIQLAESHPILEFLMPMPGD